jgi:hypothetical protein
MQKLFVFGFNKNFNSILCNVKVVLKKLDTLHVLVTPKLYGKYKI